MEYVKSLHGVDEKRKDYPTAVKFIESVDLLVIGFNTSKIKGSSMG